MTRRDERTKILYVITRSSWGGAQRYVYDLVTSLPTSDFDPVVAPGEPGELTKRLKQAGIPVSDFRIHNDLAIRNTIASIRSLFTILKEHRPDILHINSSKAGLVAAIAGRLARTRSIIFTSHGWAFFEDRSLGARLLIWMAQWLTVLLSHKVIAVSEHIRQNVPSLFVSKRKVTVIRHGIAPFPLAVKESARAMLLGEKSSELKHVTWIGTISELNLNKGVRYAIRAMKELPNAIFVVIGEGVERRKLEQEIRELELSDRVFLAGHKERAHELLSAFDVFCLTSTTEALGYSLLEAGRAGLPVVASDVGGIPEIIDDGKSGTLVESRNVAALSTALTALIESDEKRERVRRALKEKVEQEFSLHQMVEKTLQLYQT